LHSAFPHILTGADQGVSFRPIPKELALKDYIDTYRDFKGQEPGTWAFTRKPLSVDVTDKFLRRLEDAGYSKGGLAHLAGGGSPKDQDLLSAFEFERRKEGRPSNYNRGTLSRGNSRADIDIASDNGGNVYQNYYRYSDPEAAQRDYENLLAESEMRNDLSGYAEGGKTPAWQRAEGKNPEGGLNAKGRASYKAETGGTLKRPQPEGGARRDSFCARMTGMKKKLTSSKTANDPDSRINKALRKWKC
jgi:hypothetical protein